MRVLRLLYLASVLVSAACGGSDPVRPSATPPSSSGPLFNVNIVSGSGYVATFNGVTYRDVPQFLQLPLPPGRYTVSGTYQGAGALFVFTVVTTSTTASVTPGSMRVLSGANATVEPCGITFTNNSLSTTPNAFSLEFQIQAGSGGTCIVR